MNEIFTFLGLINHSHGFIFVSHMLLVGIIVLVIAKLATSKMQLVPSGVQNLMEAYLEGVISMGKDVVGEELARKYLPLVATIGLIVFFANVIGIIPGFESPSSNINMTLLLALVVFIYYNYEGIRVNGVVKYFGHFMGPMKILAPLMFPIEIVSQISKVMICS
jgi:F-type H+-transporting ATPase subunit a